MQVADGLLQLKHLGDGFTVDEVNQKIHVNASGGGGMVSETINVLDLGFEPYHAGSNLQVATWTFTKQYAKPFLMQMATADMGMANGSPVVYFYDVTPTSAKIVIATGVLTTLRNLNRKIILRAVESDGYGGSGSGDVSITSEVIHERLVENILTFDEVNHFNDVWGNTVEQLGGVTIKGVYYPIDKVARIKGTNWFVFGSSQLG